MSPIQFEIEDKVKANFNCSELILQDLTGSGSSFLLIIVSEDFKPMKLL